MSLLTKSRDLDALSKSMLVLVGLWSIVMLGVAFWSGIAHDYGWYLEQWSRVLAGVDPWVDVVRDGNAYGPVHNLLAYLTPMGALAPKLFIVVSFLFVNGLLVIELVRRQQPFRPRLLILYLLLVPLNFLVISSIVIFGDNDGLVAALVGLAVIARFRNRLVLTGVFLGLAVLLKYYPALLIPFFCLDARRIQVRTLVSALLTVGIGLGVSARIWGTGFVDALRFGADRAPSLQSIMVVVHDLEPFGADSPLQVLLIERNGIFVVCCVVAALLIVYGMRLTWIEGASVGFLIMLLTYKVGHTQFYVPWLVLLVGLLIAGTPRSRRLAYSLLPYVVYLSVFQYFFYRAWTTGMLWQPEGSFFWNYAGVPAFVLGTTCLAIGMLMMARARGSAPSRGSAT